MKVTSTLVIGGTNFKFEIEEAKELEALNRAIVLASPPTYCTVCKMKDSLDGFHMTTNKDKESNIYINVKHNKCGGKVKLGSYKQGGYFWHREFEVYKGNNTSDQQQEEE